MGRGEAFRGGSFDGGDGVLGKLVLLHKSRHATKSSVDEEND